MSNPSNNDRFKTNRQLLLYFLHGALPFFGLSACFAALVSLFDMVSPKIISFMVDSVIGEEAPALPGPLTALLARAGGIEALRQQPLRVAILVAAVGALAARKTHL